MSQNGYIFAQISYQYEAPLVIFDFATTANLPCLTGSPALRQRPKCLCRLPLLPFYYTCAICETVDALSACDCDAYIPWHFAYFTLYGLVSQLGIIIASLLINAVKTV